MIIHEYCFNCGKVVPAEEETLINNLLDAQTSEKTYPSWIKGNNWIQFFLDPEKLHNEEDDKKQLWFIWICPDCFRELGSFANHLSEKEAKK